ncbi:carboxylate--amine ligase [Blastococcus sp. TF02-8]|uniref:carboxylate-amine ligase n=1 Tax=Blastococcus sp. TF02-8 TaxID=2250574 RepID=UPI000DE914FF|nr:glutamate--cysteine ligase [Blastococcus sp. TF02-8]RBY97469.1 carboxylate--amine ligase [Blastococcus sp. TF02-8]
MRTVGVEEELLVVDATGHPVPKGPDALAVASRRGEGEDVQEHQQVEDGEAETPETAHLMPELKAQQLELGTPVCQSLEDVHRELRYWRDRADAVATAVGARVAALATSPVDVVPIPTEGERYGRLNEAFGQTAWDVLTCGCHVHVSVEDDDEGVAVLNRIRIWLPVLTAMTANSPFWQGRDTAYASFRSQVWHRWPSAGPNGPFADAADYHQLVEEVLATETVLDTGMVYFDARLSAKWPTVEVRTADVALRVEDAVTLAGVVRGLVETAARDARVGGEVPHMRPEVLRLAAWRAGRSGLSGDLVHPSSGRPVPAADVLGDLLDHIRPALADAGDERTVAGGLQALLTRGTGADLQRRVHRETGDLTAVVRAAVAATGGTEA